MALVYESVFPQSIKQGDVIMFENMEINLHFLCLDVIQVGKTSKAEKMNSSAFFK